MGAVLRNEVSCQTPPTPHHVTGHILPFRRMCPATQPHALRAYIAGTAPRDCLGIDDVS